MAALIETTVRMVDYSEKSIVLTGNTKPYKEEIKSLGGRWNSRLKDGDETMMGWIFPKKLRRQGGEINTQDVLQEFVGIVNTNGDLAKWAREISWNKNPKKSQSDGAYSSSDSAKFRYSYVSQQLEKRLDAIEAKMSQILQYIEISGDTENTEESVPDDQPKSQTKKSSSRLSLLKR